MIALLVINESTAVSSVLLQRYCVAIEEQWNGHVAPSWGRSTITITPAEKGAATPVGAWPIYVRDNPPDSDGTLGDHTESGGVPYGEVFAKYALDNGADPAGVLSHEVIELVLNPFVAVWEDGPVILEGSQYVGEGCDPVESDTYEIDGVVVSNFILPSWFDQDLKYGTNIKYDYLAHLKAPFTIDSGGYMVVRAPGGEPQQKYGDKLPEWRKALHRHPRTRGGRLCARL